MIYTTLKDQILNGRSLVAFLLRFAYPHILALSRIVVILGLPHHLVMLVWRQNHLAIFYFWLLGFVKLILLHGQSVVGQSTGSVWLVHVTLYDFLLCMGGLFLPLVTFHLLAKALLLLISGRWLVLVGLGRSDGLLDSVISLLLLTAVRGALASDSIPKLHVAGLSVAPSRLKIEHAWLLHLATLQWHTL